MTWRQEPPALQVPLARRAPRQSRVLLVLLMRRAQGWRCRNCCRQPLWRTIP
jgi:hypothetical protein